MKGPSSFARYLQALSSHWLTLVFGGIAPWAILEPIHWLLASTWDARLESFLSDALRRTIARSFVLGAFAMAGFWTWRDAVEQRERLGRELATLQADLRRRGESRASVLASLEVVLSCNVAILRSDQPVDKKRLDLSGFQATAGVWHEHLTKDETRDILAAQRACENAQALHDRAAAEPNTGRRIQMWREVADAFFAVLPICEVALSTIEKSLAPGG